MSEAESMPTTVSAAGAGSSPVPTSDATRGAGLKKTGFGLLVVGAIVSVGALMSPEAHQRLGFSYLIAFVVCWAVVLGSLFFVALQHVTKSVWSVTLRRAAEMLMSPMWLLAVLFVPLLAFALLNKDLGIFAWLRPGDLADQHLPNTHTMDAKAPYLNENFFYVRTAAFFLIWIGFVAFFQRGSKRQDGAPPSSNTSTTMQKVAAPFMVVFAFTLTFAAFDWMMALRMDWFSTMYGVYIFSGVVLSGLAAVTLAVIYMRSKGYIEKGLVRSDHLYSLGALLFAFTCFWGYIAISQYMLIWYANMPEETVYYFDRMQGGWLTVTVLAAFLRFVLPFFLLLSRSSKMDPRRLSMVAVLILVGQVVDTYWLVMPEVPGVESAMPAWFDIGPLLFLGGVLLVYVGLWLGRNRAVASGDPLFEQSRNFHL